MSGQQLSLQVDVPLMGMATLSDCGRYRYRLDRQLGGDGGECCFIMLNPSTADAEQDDPTIRRCKFFAKREGCSRLVVVNVFALRATDPSELFDAADPVGPDNIAHLDVAVHHADLVVVAWGAHKATNACMAMTFPWLLATSMAVYCLGRTKSGAPRHPLYIRKDQPLERWLP